MQFFLLCFSRLVILPIYVKVCYFHVDVYLLRFGMERGRMFVFPGGSSVAGVPGGKEFLLGSLRLFGGRGKHFFFRVHHVLLAKVVYVCAKLLAFRFLMRFYAPGRTLFHDSII